MMRCWNLARATCRGNTYKNAGLNVAAISCVAIVLCSVALGASCRFSLLPKKRVGVSELWKSCQKVHLCVSTLEKYLPPKSCMKGKRKGQEAQTLRDTRILFCWIHIGG
uniref:Histone-lysine N-methyltransferase SUVR2 isoform X1 n=1 Tax=Rhizophora mucronata TaxID=61149 RepID=A0A2P2MMV6_RHIMU